MGADRTGVFASDAETTEAARLFAEARNAPVMRVHGTWLNDEALSVAQVYVDRIAVQHGLPEPAKDPDGDVIHYGILRTGEFTKWDGQ